MQRGFSDLILAEASLDVVAQIEMSYALTGKCPLSTQKPEVEHLNDSVTQANTVTQAVGFEMMASFL